MQIQEKTVGDVTILDLKGKMTLGEGDELLKEKINGLIQGGKKKLVLNLEGVPYVDSAGLGELVRTYTTVSRQGGSLKLLNLTKRIQDLLAITKLLTVFDTFDTDISPGARRPTGKARRPSISGICKEGATQLGGMPRPGVMPRMTESGH
ncbi:MAG: STAS domain-containing protein [Acidobacteria bacterium]|nr:STAS domain-containing protein [Acidobacteriota bacterium]